MLMLFIVGITFFALVFTLHEFCDLMRRRDDEFAGRYDKPIWAAAILLTNVFGAFAYWISKPHPVPSSSDDLRRQYAATLEPLATKPHEPH